MKQRYISRVAAGLALAVTAGAQAAVYIPPAGPLYIKFSNAEQICIQGDCITAPNTENPGAAAPAGTAGGAEQNWGVLTVSTIFGGTPTPANPYLYGNNGIPLFNTLSNGNDQITGIFYGIQSQTGTVANPIRSQSGYMDLWYDEDVFGTGTFANESSALPTGRTGVNEFTGFTDGTFLGRIAFAPGIDPAGADDVTIIGSASASEVGAGTTGFADSFGDVVDVNGDGVIDSGDGVWAALLNGNYFPVMVDRGLGLQQEFRDFRFKNSYNLNPDWSQTDIGAVGATSDDPARVFAVPEPSALALIGLGLVAVGFRLRRQKA